MEPTGRWPQQPMSWWDLFWSRSYPMSSLPFSIRELMGRSLDISNGYRHLAERLRYTNQETDAIEARTRHQPENQGSVTLALYRDYETRNGTVQQVQEALIRMSHTAADVIPRYFREIEAEYQTQMSPPGIRTGIQNQELSGPCECAVCMQQRMVSGASSLSSGSGARDGPQRSPHQYMPNALYRNQVPLDPRRSPTSNSIGRNPQLSRFPNGQNMQNVQSVVEREPNWDDVSGNQPMQIVRSDIEWTPPSDRTTVNNATRANLTMQSARQNVGEDVSLFSPLMLTDSFDRSSCSGQSGSPPVSPDRQCVSCPCNTCRINSSSDETAIMKLFDSSEGTCINAHTMAELKIQSDDTALKSSHKESQSSTYRQTSMENKCTSVAQNNLDKRTRNSWPNQMSSKTEVMSTASSDSVPDMRVSSNSGDSDSVSDYDCLVVYSRNGQEQRQLYVDVQNDLNTTSGDVTLNVQNIQEQGAPMTMNDTTSQNASGTHKSLPVSKRPASIPKSPSVVFKYRGFVTYCLDGVEPADERHLKEVTDMCQTLYHNGIKLKLDMGPETFKKIAENKFDWLDKMIEQATFVIVCISPAYQREVERTDTHIGSRPTYSDLNARYIFNQLRAEYDGNGCRNFRMIPVLFPNSGATRDNIPACMRTTLVFTYPSKLRELLNFILHNYVSRV